MMRVYSPAGTAFVPLNIMCSSTCASPVLPGTSSMLPILYQTMLTTTGARVSVFTRMRIPFASACSATGALPAGHAAGVNAQKAHSKTTKRSLIGKVRRGDRLKLYLSCHVHVQFPQAQAARRRRTLPARRSDELVRQAQERSHQDAPP